MDKYEMLKKLREPFLDCQIGLLPKPTKSKDEMKAIQKAVCKECGGYHAIKNIIHLRYVGHAPLTDRLLDVDPEWGWKPMSFDSDGLPRFDKVGGLWIYLTVCGVTKPGYGIAEGKSGGDAIKEIIGDALRNAAMRFGCALDLWHKGDLHPTGDDDGGPEVSEASPEAKLDTNTGTKFPWSIDDLSEFETTMDRAYKAFKLAGSKDAYDPFREKWKANKAKDPAELVLDKLADFVNKMEAAAKKKVEASS